MQTVTPTHVDVTQIRFVDVSFSGLDVSPTPASHNLTRGSPTVRHQTRSRSSECVSGKFVSVDQTQHLRDPLRNLTNRVHRATLVNDFTI